MSEQVEPEVLHARRAFADAQGLLAGEPTAALPTRVQVGWYDTSVHPETGSFAVVAADSGLDDWIGEVLFVQANGRACFVYVMGGAEVPTPLALARRAFCALGALSTEELSSLVQVVQ